MPKFVVSDAIILFFLKLALLGKNRARFSYRKF